MKIHVFWENTFLFQSLGVKEIFGGILQGQFSLREHLIVSHNAPDQEEGQDSPGSEEK